MPHPTMTVPHAKPRRGGGFALLEALIAGSLLLIFSLSFIALLTRHSAMQVHATTYYGAISIAKSALENSAVHAYDDLPGLASSNRVDWHGIPSSTGLFMRVVAVDPAYGTTQNPTTDLTRIAVEVAYEFKGSFRNPVAFETLRWRE